MPSTPTNKLAIPLPAGGDDVAVPADLRAMAERIDEVAAWQDQGVRASRPAASSSLKGFRYLATDEGIEYLCTGTDWFEIGARVPRVTSLPSSPRDGQEVDFVADAAAGVIWRLRYRADSPNARKWEFVGGPPMAVFAAGPWTSGAVVDGTDIVSLTVPLAGDYDVRAAAFHEVAANSNAYLSSSLKQSGSGGGVRRANFLMSGHFGGAVGSTGVIIPGLYNSPSAHHRAALTAAPLVVNIDPGPRGTIRDATLSLSPVRV